MNIYHAVKLQQLNITSSFLSIDIHTRNRPTKGYRSTQEQLRAPHTWSWGERSTTLDSWEVACVSTPQFKHLFTVHSPTASLCTKYECSYNSKSKCIQPLLLRTVKSRLFSFLKEFVTFSGVGWGLGMVRHVFEHWIQIHINMHCTDVSK